jgi:fatty-acyl-CoA synthase/long-chain acyl-CoA synthetase
MATAHQFGRPSGGFGTRWQSGDLGRYKRAMPDFLTGYAQLQPEKVAVIDDRPDGAVESLTFYELDERSTRLGHALLSLGAAPGRKIVWCGPNSIGAMTLINAARKIGVTAVPLNYRLAPDEAAYVTDHSDAVIVYADAEYASLFASIRRELPKVESVVVFGGRAPEGMVSADELIGSSSAEPLPDVEAGSTMIYTSGTTGKPKGAFRQGAGDPSQVAALLGLIGYTSDDLYITTGPLYHSGPGGFMGIAQVLGQSVIVQRKFDPEDWLRLLDKYQVSSTFSAPTPIRMVCSLPAEVKARYDTSSMKRMIANAAPWSYALKQMYVRDFPADSLFEVYGSTELGVNTILLPADQLRKPGSCGRAAPGVEVRLFDDDGNEVTGIGPEHPGELFVQSASVFADYYKQHDKYEADMRGDFHTVGDIAYRDDEGFYYICDRKKDMIISGGMNIYPAEIEAALETHPDIYEAAVFGIPSDEWGESVHAVVVLRPGAMLTAEDVQAHARGLLAGYKIPRSVSFADELPKTGSGKLLKRELRAPYWAGRTAQV